MIYAEVEPDVEYYIEVEIVGGDDPKKLHRVDFYVDGNELPYYKAFRKTSGKQYAGIYSYKDGIGKQVALAFERLPINDDGVDSTIRISTGATMRSNTSTALMGSVKVEFSEVIYAGTRALENVSTSIEASSFSNSGSRGETKKVLRSGKGSHSQTMKVDKGAKLKFYARGELLQSITINYCAAAGLIQAGVFSKASSGSCVSRADEEENTLLDEDDNANGRVVVDSGSFPPMRSSNIPVVASSSSNVVQSIKEEEEDRNQERDEHRVLKRKNGATGPSKAAKRRQVPRSPQLQHWQSFIMPQQVHQQQQLQFNPQPMLVQPQLPQMMVQQQNLVAMGMPMMNPYGGMMMNPFHGGMMNGFLGALVPPNVLPPQNPAAYFPQNQGQGYCPNSNNGYLYPPQFPPHGQH